MTELIATTSDKLAQQSTDEHRANDHQQPQSQPQHCYLGLGGNLSNELGSPTEHILRAVATLKSRSDVRQVRLSSLYASKPMGPQDQPDFINAVVELVTDLPPLALLAVCQQLEQDAERVRLRRWGERSLDVDLLLYGDQQLALPSLIVPHAGIRERNFVLVPLAELNPNLAIHGRPISEYPASKDWSGLTKLAKLA